MILKSLAEDGHEAGQNRVLLSFYSSKQRVGTRDRRRDDVLGEGLKAARRTTGNRRRRETGVVLDLEGKGDSMQVVGSFSCLQTECWMPSVGKYTISGDSS